MRRTVPFALVGALLAPALLSLGACDPNFSQRGFAATPGSVEKLEVGSQSREDVVRLIGSPSAVATFNPNIWYYISQMQEYWAFLKPEVTQQKIIQITFNDSGRISAIKNYDLADARDIEMVQRITPTSGKQLTVLEQILGNVGKFNPASKSGSGPGAPTGGSGAPTSGSGL
jgi:outer membrane protein assembly factor BamE (lipoprotein component of BamABCDE complex)